MCHLPKILHQMLPYRFKSQKVFTITLVVCFDFCHTDELVSLKRYIYFLIVVSGVSVFDYKWGKILRKMVVVCLIFGRMLRLCFLFLYICL